MEQLVAVGRPGQEVDQPGPYLRQWGDKYLSEKPSRLLRRKADKTPVIAAFVPKGADVLRFDELELVPGPGLKVG